MKKNVLIIAVILFIVLTGGGYILLQGGTGNNTKIQMNEVSKELDEWNESDDSKGQAVTTDDFDNPDGEEIKEVQVYICGAVKNAGVYTLEEGMRLHDLLELCGGALEDAHLETVNLARVVTDGEKVYILNKEEAKAQKHTQEVDAAKMDANVEIDTRININTALKEALMTLPGIGEAKAESIIHYRETQKPFEATSDIMKIEGIKKGIYEKIKDKITI